MKKILLFAGLAFLVVVLLKLFKSPSHIPEKIITNKDFKSKTVIASTKTKIQQKKILSKSQCVKLAYDVQAFIMRIRLNPNSLTMSECKKMRGHLALNRPEHFSDNSCLKTINQNQKEVLVACH